MASSSTLGAFKAFDFSIRVAGPLYMEMFVLYIASYEVTPSEKKRAVVCTRRPYNDIVSKFNTRFNPKPSVIVQWFQFVKRDKRPGETVADYAADLRRLSEQ
ncbi:hypothetical protein HPB50_012843 [Hyalomma asiaticum]|uniref:Uncharacterized protein n=1 Tax=Hyalomma asiaticum TaxID=266040 RepID=A0ACB7T9W6_HYAAI|nr:hypothetical protein HPB50_012843 [Hyalomma asiaticum]